MMYVEAMPINNYQTDQKTYNYTINNPVSATEAISKYGKDFFMQKNFQDAKERENNILYKKTGKRLSEDKLSLLDNLFPAYINTHIIMSFYEDKIKTVFTLDNIKYFVDFIFGESFAYVGRMANKEYELRTVDLQELNSFIAERR